MKKRNQPDLKLSFAVVKKEECVFNKKQNKNHVVSFFVFYFCFYSIPRLTHKQECPRRLPGPCPLAEIPEALAVTGTRPRVE